MQPTHFLGRTIAALAPVAFAIALTSATSLAASPFEGKWKVQDTKGNPFEITLSDDGSAKGDREGEGLAGTWKAEGRRRGDQLGVRLDDQDHQGRRPVQEDRL